MSTALGSDRERLNGWKEIALHLGKGARTVQRWEKLYGLPVHRIGREGGEIVFAFRDEIDRWLAATDRERDGDEIPSLREASPDRADAGPAPPPAPRESAPIPARRRRGWTVAGMLLALGGVGFGGWLALRRTPTVNTRKARSANHQPTSWRLANEALTAFDADGGLVFEHQFGFALQDNGSSGTWPSERGSPPVLIVDLDSDGRNEVLVKANATERAQRRLYCFEADGRLRFVHQPTGTRRFGNDVYAEPWLVHRIFLTAGPDGARRVWAVFTHGFLFPSVLEELDARSGAVRQEYWSNGYIEHVHEGTWAGRPVVLVGGGNNDFRAASLAVFPPDGVSGATPAVRSAYACRDCPPGDPVALFIFPSLCMSRLAGEATVLDAWVEHSDRIRVIVAQRYGPSGGATYYTLGPDGAVLSAEISREFQAAHAVLERQGILDHPFGPSDDRDMFPVRRWDGRRFVELPRVPVTH
jgi:hypothetical protein